MWSPRTSAQGVKVFSKREKTMSVNAEEQELQLFGRKSWQASSCLPDGAGQTVRPVQLELKGSRLILGGVPLTKILRAWGLASLISVGASYHFWANKS